MADSAKSPLLDACTIFSLEISELYLGWLFGIFDIKLSIEKDINAHKTLTLRSFYRQFVKDNRQVPKEYYDALRETDLSKREILIEKMFDFFT